VTAAVSGRALLSALWVALMLVYLLGDVLRIFAGDFTPGEMAGTKAAPWMWTLAAAVMLIPIVMLVASLVLTDPALRWVTVGAAGFLIVFNLSGLPYPGTYDNLLIGVGIAINAVTIWQVWTLTA
jgi:hypothetical protein